MVLKSRNTNLDVLVDKITLPDSIPSSDFSIFRFFTGSVSSRVNVRFSISIRVMVGVGLGFAFGLR